MGLGSQQAPGLPFLLFHLTFLLLFFFFYPFPAPLWPGIQLQAAANTVSPFLMVLSVALQGQPGPEGSPGAKGYPGRQVQYMASGSSVAMVMWKWPRVPQAEGGNGPGSGARAALLGGSQDKVTRGLKHCSTGMLRSVAGSAGIQGSN